MPDSIGLLKNLTRLTIEKCKISTLPESIGQLSNLKELFLYLNDIKNLPESIGNLKNLKKLALSYNQIRELPESIGQLSNLQELRVSSNKLSKLSESIGNLVNLEKLDVDANKLGEIPESIGNLLKLNKLNAASNRLEELPTSLFNLVNLKELNLSGNIITELSDSISNLSKLNEINMSCNPLQKLPASLDLLKNFPKSEKNHLAKVVESSEEFLKKKIQKRYFELCSDREKELDFCDGKTRTLYVWTSFLTDPPELEGYVEVKTFKSKLNRQNNVEEKLITVLQKNNLLIAIHNDEETQKKYVIPYEWNIRNADWEKKEATFQFVIGRSYWLYLAMDFETAIDFLTVMGVYPIKLDD